jgi:hypothetical protein
MTQHGKQSQRQKNRPERMTKKKKQKSTPKKSYGRKLTNYERAAVMAYVDPDCESRKEAILKAYPKAKGWTRASLCSWTTKVFQRPHVEAEVKKQQNLLAQRMRKRYALTSERVIDEVRCLALARMTDVFQYEKIEDQYGRTSYRMDMTDFDKLPEEAKAAIKKIKVKTVQHADKEEKQLEILEIEVQMYDKAASLRDLGKHFGLFNEQIDVNHSGVVGHVHTTMAEVRECFQAMTQKQREEWLETKAKELTNETD